MVSQAVSHPSGQALVLVIDDDLVLADTLGRVLRAHGHAALLATSGQEGLALVAGQHEIAAIICDLKMPDLDGAEVLRRVRQMQAPPPVIVLTGQADVDLAVRLMKEGAFDYLIKPAASDVLVRTVRQAIAQHMMSEENAALRRVLEYQQAFISITSHELRTPLTIMSGFLDLLMQDELTPDKRRSYLQKVRGSTRTLQALVEQIHGLALADAGQMVAQPEWIMEEIDILDLADRAIGDARQLASQRNQTIVRDVVGDACTLWGSAVYLHTLLLELLVNAVRFSADGRSTTMRVESTAHDVAFWVIDHGIGIPEDHQSRIFDRFYTASPKTHSPERGSEFMANHLGVGLSIARGIARAHGGVLTVSSIVGEGSIFTLRIPRRQLSDVMIAAQNQTSDRAAV